MHISVGSHLLTAGRRRDCLTAVVADFRARRQYISTALQLQFADDANRERLPNDMTSTNSKQSRLKFGSQERARAFS